MMQNRKGFTLIELLIVVVIIGILAAIAIPKFANTKEKAYIAAMKSDLRNLVTAQEAYFADNNTYTATLGAGGVDFVSSKGVTVVAQANAGLGHQGNSSHTGTLWTCQITVGSFTAVGDADGEPVCTPP
jgi:prepilin-type N-terminal cleavage/methylation domain-containing protein